MNDQQRNRFTLTPAHALLCAAAFTCTLALTGCNGAGQNEVTQGDRPSEGEGWAVQEQMADSQGQ